MYYYTHTQGRKNNKEKICPVREGRRQWVEVFIFIFIFSHYNIMITLTSSSPVETFFFSWAFVVTDRSQWGALWYREKYCDL